MPVRFRKEILCHVKRVVREDPKFAKTKLYLPCDFVVIPCGGY